MVAVMTATAAILVGTARSEPATSTACTAAATKATVASFMTSFNRGDYDALQAMFAREPSFQWYSANAPGLRVRAAAHNRATLIRYFRARHAKRDRMRLVSVRFTGNSRGHGAVPDYGNFVAVLRRSTSDYRNGAWFGLISKGAIVCSAEPSVPQFIVFSFGGPGSAGG
jgi:hypothetical protein